MRNLADMIGKLTPTQIKNLLESMDPVLAQAILDDWDLWALDYQRLPEGDWRIWVIRAGRGAGKTYGASKTTNEVARDRSKIRTGEIGIIARTWTEARKICVEGPSGILATAPSYFKPEWHPGIGLLVWPNGVRGHVYSADKPESIRGPNFSWVWADEICHWDDPETTWHEVIKPAIRIGWARAMMTTTPTRDPFLGKIEDMETTVVTRAPTFANRYLAKDVKDDHRKTYEGTTIGRQELYGEILSSVAGALWKQGVLDNHRVSVHPDLRKIVVAVDPAVTANENSDETGIVVYGVDADEHGYLLHDASGKYEPAEWGKIVVSLYNRYRADEVVAEINQGGNMVEHTIRTVHKTIPYRGVRAKRGKELRAQPVASLYEQGRCHHVGTFDQLEEQLVTWVPGKSKKGSPDRLDALVYAAMATQIEPGVNPNHPLYLMW